MYTTTNAPTGASAAKNAEHTFEREPPKFVKRIGSTTYEVTVRFSDKTTETFEQKLLKLIESEVRQNS